MDITWLLVILILVIIFASISIVGALHRIRDASETAVALLEQHAARQKSESPSQ
jgi:hypothetical protein